jgi:hypothetical protein
MRPSFRVVAIVAAYNEGDIIEQVVADLVAQGVDVYALDDGSTDDTADVIERFVGRGVLALERRRAANGAPSDGFDWARILQRKSEIARELDADWFIHHDADEFRESPWRGMALRDAVARVDAAGYNAIDFLSLDFWPIHDQLRAADDVRESFTHYTVSAPYDRVQIRCWKKTDRAVDLASSGGHDAQFPGRHVFPIRFISRHYPIRSQAQGVRKVFVERRGRFRSDERARGWHVQYDEVPEGTSFVRDPSTLTPYDPDAIRIDLSMRHRGVEALEASLDQARRAGEARRQEIDSLDAALRAAHDDLRAQSVSVALLRSEVERLSGDLATLRTELDAICRESEARAAEINAATDFVHEQAQTIEGLQTSVAALQQRVDELVASFSWRVTAPARAVLRAIGGR